MFDLLRPFLSRIIAAGVAAISSWILTATGIAVDAETGEALVSVGIFISFLLYSFVHKLIDKKINPVDAAAADTAAISAGVSSTKLYEENR